MQTTSPCPRSAIFHARLAFANNDLRIERFNGEVGGGKIGVSGHVGFAKLDDLMLDIAAKAEDVLAVRDDNLTARVNADVKVAGPFKAASVSGYIGITKSRYLKDIDIVPLNTPGKPAPAPPAPSSGGEASIGVGAAPINAWKLDLTIKTATIPSSSRGNLAHGQALVDLHVHGTGGQPLLDGNVEIKDLVTTLPFSTLDIADGNIAFTPDHPLNPVLDIQGTSSIRNYLVTVYVTGAREGPEGEFYQRPARNPGTDRLPAGDGIGRRERTHRQRTSPRGQGRASWCSRICTERAFPKKASAREEPKILTGRQGKRRRGRHRPGNGQTTGGRDVQDQR